MGLPFRIGAGGGAASLGLKTNLVAWWELDEASGNRADSHTNGLTLTDNNTVTSNPGIGGSGTAAQFTSANSEFLSSNSATLNLVNNQSISIVLWVYMDTSAQMAFLGRGITSDALRFQQYLIGYGYTASRFNFSLARNDQLSTYNVAADTFGAPSTATWYMIAGTFNEATDQLKISVNAGAQDTTSSVISTGMQDSNGFSIGKPGDTNARYANGRIAKAGIWLDRVLTTTDITNLYNNGAGLSYAGLT